MKEISIDNLGGRTKEIISFYMQNPTMTYREIAEKMGVSSQRVGHILNNPRVISLYPLLARRRVQSKILPKALKRYEDIIEHSKNDAVAEKAAQRVLEAENVFDGPKLTITNELSSKSIEDLRKLIAGAKEGVAPNVIEGEIIPDTIQDTTQP